MKKQKMTSYPLFGMCMYFIDNLVVVVVDDELKRVLAFTPKIEREGRVFL
jgi:hypothetical protein